MAKEENLATRSVFYVLFHAIRAGHFGIFDNAGPGEVSLFINPYELGGEGIDIVIPNPPNGERAAMARLAAEALDTGAYHTDIEEIATWLVQEAEKGEADFLRQWLFSGKAPESRQVHQAIWERSER